MLSFNEILQRIEKEIKNLRFEEPPRSLFRPIEYTLTLGGKRIRPAFTLIACNIYREDVEDAIYPALGLEVFHNFTLLHDDLMDEADKRRNKPTVHNKWNANTAILSGDAMLIVAYQLIGETVSHRLKEVLDIFTQTALEICEGQEYDMEFESRMDVSEEEYIEMIRLKTAVLIACCLKTGAIVGGALREDAEHLYRYGINIGLAFQLQDDLLDVYGDSQTFGKNIGGDILCNKKTFLLVQALKLASGKLKEELVGWLEKKDFVPGEKIAEMTSLYNRLGIKELTDERIRYFYAEALKNLSKVKAPKERLAVLYEVGEHLMSRNA
ncbi:polyprenyl synthetase family protein [Parabacteroides sp. Marseille-P3160]|uniref:polyprenyl synthetase family protein n=1 Tax=Parabacteroides sp. Marseille-P3160 TaxID=1917887 RepID=UPI0009BAE8FE|nr:polyprenyl synthetase family protein [Parabacteroides sp. Marseille-P3160]